MASAGRKIGDEEFVSYILVGLDLEFNLIVSTIAACVEPISVGDLYTKLMSFELRMEIHGGGNQSSANTATRGGRGNNSRGGGHGGGRGGFGHG